MEDLHKKNQPFRTLDAVSVLVLFAVVMTVCGAILSETFRDDRPVRAKASAEALAHQILAQRTMATTLAQDPPARGLASVEPVSEANGLTDGTLGKDPWGHPFHYHVQPLGEAAKAMVFVWSDGPNSLPESAEAVRSAVDPANVRSFRFRGDDLGHVQISEMKL